jgi:hypothetical protein
MKTRSLLTFMIVVSLAVAACDSGEEAVLSTTSSLVTGTTETPAQTPTTTEAGTSVTTVPLVGEAVGSYEITVRIAADNGEIFYIVIPEGAYTDVDLENFLGDLKEGNPDLWGVEVFDDESAVQAFAIPEDQRTEEQQALIDEHHFVSLIDGDTVKYRGPFSDSGEFVIGS